MKAKNNILAFLAEDAKGIQCAQSSATNDFLTPTILQDKCKFQEFDYSMGDITNKWVCDFDAVTMAAWTGSLDGKLKKVKVAYPYADGTMTRFN